MKTPIILSSLQSAFRDRGFIGVFIILVLLAMGLCIYVGFSIHPSDLQVVTHYTAFGPTNFYRDKWYYLIVFIAAALLSVIFYGAIASKILERKGRALAIPFLWLGVVVTILSIAAIHQILKLAALS